MTGFIGGGNMAEALIKGLVKDGKKTLSYLNQLKKEEDILKTVTELKQQLQT